MSITYGFFNSVAGDRLYNADDISRMFEPYSTDGVFKEYSNGFKVGVNNGLSVAIHGGMAKINGKWVRNSGVETRSISPTNSSFDRIDAVVLRLDSDEREITLEIKEGTPAMQPKMPEIINRGGIREICLAVVNVAAGATEIIDSDIIDKREDETLCGFARPYIGYRMKKYQNTVMTDADISSIDIGIPQFDNNLDILLCYINGVVLTEGIEYTVSGQKIKFKNSLPKNNRITFVVMKYEVV